jgi:hypothetical protein
MLDDHEPLPIALRPRVVQDIMRRRRLNAESHGQQRPLCTPEFQASLLERRINGAFVEADAEKVRALPRALLVVERDVW